MFMNKMLLSIMCFDTVLARYLHSCILHFISHIFKKKNNNLFLKYVNKYIINFIIHHVIWYCACMLYSCILHFVSRMFFLGFVPAESSVAKSSIDCIFLFFYLMSLLCILFNNINSSRVLHHSRISSKLLVNIAPFPANFWSQRTR